MSTKAEGHPVGYTIPRVSTDLAQQKQSCLLEWLSSGKHNSILGHSVSLSVRSEERAMEGVLNI